LCWTCGPGARHPACRARRRVSPHRCDIRCPRDKRRGVTMAQPQDMLFVLEASNSGRLFCAHPDGSAKMVIVSGCRLPDGVVVDIDAGHVYWTNMGVPSVNDGSIERVDFDGSNRVTIVPSGVAFTPKQLHLETMSRKLYWGDREGMRVMRCDLDGS